MNLYDDSNQVRFKNNGIYSFRKSEHGGALVSHPRTACDASHFQGTDFNFPNDRHLVYSKIIFDLETRGSRVKRRPWKHVARSKLTMNCYKDNKDQ